MIHICAKINSKIASRQGYRLVSDSELTQDGKFKTIDVPVSTVKQLYEQNRIKTPHKDEELPDTSGLKMIYTLVKNDASNIVCDINGRAYDADSLSENAVIWNAHRVKYLDSSDSLHTGFIFNNQRYRDFVDSKVLVREIKPEVLERAREKIDITSSDIIVNDKGDALSNSNESVIIPNGIKTITIKNKPTSIIVSGKDLQKITLTGGDFRDTKIDISKGNVDELILDYVTLNLDEFKHNNSLSVIKTKGRHPVFIGRSFIDWEKLRYSAGMLQYANVAYLELGHSKYSDTIPIRFAKYSKVKSIKIVGNIKNIEQEAFSHCSELESIDLGNTVETIEGSVFAVPWYSYNSGKKVVELKNVSSVISIEGYAFCGTLVLRKCPLENFKSLRVLKSHAFDTDDKHIENAVLPPNLKVIGKDAISAYNIELNKVVTMNSIKNILGAANKVKCKTREQYDFIKNTLKWKETSEVGVLKAW